MKKLSLLIVSILFSLSVYSQSGQKWSLSGNNITQGDFIGSTNHESLVFKTNDERRLTIKANGKIVLNTFSDSLPGLLFLDGEAKMNVAEYSNNVNDVFCGDGQFRNIDNITPFTGWKLNGMDIIADQGYNVGINTFTPEALLDVNGDAIIRGTLQVYNGIIVGRRYEGEKAVVDTVKATNMETDEMKAEQYKTNTIVIDGNNSKITSSTGLVDFDNSTIRANNMLANSFHVYGTTSMDSLKVVNQLQIGNNSLILNSNPAPTGVENRIYTDNGDLLIQSEQNYNYNTIINANNEGYVGIGTMNPQQNLHIKGVTYDDNNNPPVLSAVVRLEDVYNSSAQPTPPPRTAYWDIAASSHREGLYFSTDQGTGTSTPLEVMRLTESGQIVMGSTGNCSTPTNIKLIVDGHMLLTDGPTGEPRSIYWGYQCQPEWGIEYNQYDHGLNFWNPNTSSSGLVNYRLFLQDGTGYVGIGTNTPQYELDVCGTIRAKEVKVDLNGTCPDFVFEDDYKLMSFEELQAYIDEFGHLPGIPSAEETEKDGINVSEMNMMLLQKVEELTLYILQLENRINELENNQ